MTKIFEACLLHNQACVLSAYGEKNQKVSSCILIWDDKNLYFWQSARDRSSTTLGANMLLIWEALKLAAAKNLTFDFDSFASAHAAKMLASFEQLPVIRHQIIGSSVRYQ